MNSEQYLKFVEVESTCSVESLYSSLFSGSDNSFWLDSSLVMEGYSRFSFIGDSEGELAKLVRYKKDDNEIEVLDGSARVNVYATLEEYIKQELSIAILIPPTYILPFATGFVGYFGYESLQADIEFKSKSVHKDAELILCDRFIAFDHLTQKYYFVVRHDDKGSTSASMWIDQCRHQLAGLEKSEAELIVKNPTEKDVVCRYVETQADYVQKVNECLDYIRAGESYEITLTTEIVTHSTSNHFEIYKCLRSINPAPYSAFIQFEEISLMCSSPERFLKIDDQGNIESRPIKGTAPRSVDSADDERQKKSLGDSVKTRSENLMIVDLLRNDIGKVCEMNSVRVPSLMQVESYSTVHQLVSTITGKLRNEIHSMDAIAAAFPGGSMTGAPKKRTMELIEALESRWRGPYSGSIGYVSFDGQSDLNIVIRTLVARENDITLGVGGAIVALSDPVEEYEEAMLKAQAPLTALRMSADTEQAYSGKVKVK